MVSGKDEERIDFSKLEKELNAAVEADAKYWRENDAKIRAVTQRVESYEEFKDIVAAAHIKPLEKKDKISEKKPTPWNPHATKQTGTDVTTDKTLPQDKTTLPKNGHEFARDWKRYCKTNAQKYDYLIRIGGRHLGVIFKTEIAFGLLGEIIIALQDCFSPNDVDVVCAILDNLSKTNRFSLSLDFLSSTEKESCKELFKKLQSCIESKDMSSNEDSNMNTESLDSLISEFKVTL
ncbi:dynein axonemal assembly factor 19-like [Glandiceps talaboti]